MIVLLPLRQVIRTTLNLSLQVSCFYCNRMYVIPLENQMLSTSTEVNAGCKPSTSWTFSGNAGCGSICWRFKLHRNGSAHNQSYLLEILSLLLAKILLKDAGQRQLYEEYSQIAMETFDKLRLEQRLQSHGMMFASYAFWKALQNWRRKWNLDWTSLRALQVDFFKNLV